MSEGDVSLIRDEDVLRRMWQQTEDFSRKKEIRAHMYRLREERLRNLYTPEHTPDSKGGQFTPAQGHGTSFADQDFQSMKSKEVRDAASPSKEFTYSGQDLKEYSNAGWNVESEEHAADEGHTRVRAVHASVEGRYDVDGGAGQFAARDSHRRARTHYADDAGSLHRDESSTDTAAREHVERRTADGTHLTTTTSSSSTAQVKQVSSTKYESAPRITEHEYDQTRHTTLDDNRNENVTRITNRSDYEQSLRRTENDHGELVSRKVEYPDDNTKVIVETRCLPDGTRVTSTRREFRAPAHSTRAYTHHTNSESKSFSSQQQSDIRESSSKVTRNTIDSHNTDIVESQRSADDDDFKRQIHQYTTRDNNDDNESVQRTNQRHDIRTQRNVSDQLQTERNVSQTKYESRNKITDHSTVDQRDAVNVHRETKQTYEGVDQTDRREPHDERVPLKDIKDTHYVQTRENTIKDRNVEEVVERKTSSEHYQTTYQSDYQQKKVSNDWSPSHQAWASTLRADTPSTTRPSTRASSPGSRTFKSSTSSLRSSVSPDKTYRKPSSRGGSPNKIDRNSPTRTVTSDRYSSTQSTHSSTETKTSKYTSPERKPPSGRSPTRPSHSPEKHNRSEPYQRSPTSPEKQMHNVPSRPSSSPDRKTKSTSTDSRTSPTRPAGLPSGQPSRSSPSRSYSPDKTLRVKENSPEEDIGYRQPTDKDTKRPSVSPDRKPGYMRPTAASKIPTDTRPVNEPDRQSPTKHVTSTTPDRRHYTKTDKVIDEHYKFIDEETKILTRSNKTTIDDTNIDEKYYSQKSTESVPKASPTSPSVGKVPDDSSPSPVTKARSPSPPKRTVIITENDELYGRIDKIIETTDVITNVTQDDLTVTETQTSSREPSPTKYDTYDKKNPRETSPNKTTRDDKRDSLTRYDTYTKKTHETSSSRKSPSNTASPSKSAVKDTKYKHTTDFISTERNIEEINKNTKSTDHPRKLVTPSSSPTRKPKPIETEPSTGQSSPTTSVSGFVYFGSPRHHEPQVTDLDDEIYPEAEIPKDVSSIKRPDSLEVKRSPSPSKIPCRSPSPDKVISPMKEKLPRKSSLKKPSTPANDVNVASPIEKPPTSFLVSPTEDKKIPAHHVVKKNKPEEPEHDSAHKIKPPFQRRETYEDRCRKILGMDETTTETVAKETKRYTKRPQSIESSPSVSPCESPAPNESSPVGKNIKHVVLQTETDITDFITREIDENIKTTDIKTTKTFKTPSRETSPTKVRTPSGDTSPTKLQGITIKTKTETSETLDETKSFKNKHVASPTQQPQDLGKVEKLRVSPEKQKPKTASNLRDTSPSKSARPGSKLPADSPVRDSSPTKSPRGTPGRTTITTKTSEFDTVSVTTDNKETTTDTYVKTKHPTRILQSPTREIPSRDGTSSPRSSHSPTKQYPSSSPERKLTSPDSKTTTQSPDYREDVPEVPRKSPSRSRETTPGYMKTTKAVSTKQDSILTTEYNKEYVTSKTVDKKDTTTKTISPDRKQAQDTPRAFSPSKTSPTRPDNSPERKMQHHREQSPKPNYMKSTAAATARKDSVTVEETHETTVKTVDTKYATTKTSVSPTRKPTHEQPRPTTKRPTELETKKPTMSPDRKTPSTPIKDELRRSASPTKDDIKKYKKSQTSPKSPTRTQSDNIPGYMRTTESTSTKFEITKHEHDTSDIKESFSSVTEKSTYSRRSESPIDHLRHQSPSRQISPDCKNDDHKTNNDSPLPSYMKPTAAVINKFESTTTKDSEEIVSSKTFVKKISVKDVLDKTETKTETSKRTDVSPQRKPTTPVDSQDVLKTPTDSHEQKPSYMKPTASVKSKHQTTEVTENTYKQIQEKPRPQDEPRDTRSPSPTKKTSKSIEITSEFILSEKDQEIIDRVQKSLRQLSPERKEKSPSRERSPTKSTTSLQDLDIVTTETVQTKTFTGEDLADVIEEKIMKKKEIKQKSRPEDIPIDRKPSSKPSSRNVSPTKKSPSTPTKIEKAPEYPTKSRSISPKKPAPGDRPQSPQIQKASGIKPREQIPSHLTRKPTPATLKIDKLSIDTKKSNGMTRHTTVSKTTSSTKVTSTTSKLMSPTANKTSTEQKRIPSPKRINEISPTRRVKETVTRTSSDINIKSKKTSPQRMRSKPEIQIHDLSSKTTHPKSPTKEHHTKLPTKPKSATSLNTTIDEDDVIVDVQQSKSSRENSPDRICPTPVNFTDDVGTPRFPDEVKEPDDDFRRHTYHTIHETESVVDDIVEICEDEELFIKKSDNDFITEEDDSLLSVNAKVNKFTRKMDTVTKPKDTTVLFKETEKTVHSDLVDENLKSDECLLSVSEKVNKFAKGPRDIRDKSPSKRITDEYDKDTVYTDDYTKLSVNDKAHLFVETAESIKAPKYKTTQKVERPDLSNVGEDLKSDECLLSVSDKVNKFVKTAEQFLTETQEFEEKDRKIKDKHQQIMKHIIDDDEVTFEIKTTHETTPKEDHRKPQLPDSVKPKELKTPKSEHTDKKPTVKITTLRSSEAVKKAKALFENIATTQKTQETTSKTTKLTDIGVIKKSPKTDSTTALHPSFEDVSPVVADVERDVEKPMPTSVKEHPSHDTPTRGLRPHVDEKHRSSPSRLTTPSPAVPRPKSPMRQTLDVTKTVVNKRVPSGSRAESPVQRSASPRPRVDTDKTPGYLRPTKTSQNKEETKVVEEYEVSSRRGSGKFGVELRRTSVERSTVSSERRRSVDHPCIEDIYDLDLLEQMLEKVVGYEQRRRIRAQIRIVKKETEHTVHSQTRTTKHTTSIHASSPKPRSPERQAAKSPERTPKSTQKHLSPDRLTKTTLQKSVLDRSQPRTPITNGHVKEPMKSISSKLRPQSPEKTIPKSVGKSPSRQPSPEKKRTVSPTKVTSKPKTNRFNEYASAYMKKVGLTEAEKVKINESKNKRINQTVKHETRGTVQEFTETTTKSITERTSSKDVIELVQVNGKRSPSPDMQTSQMKKAKSPERKAPSPVRKTSPERKAHSPERLHQRTPSPDFKRPLADTGKETIIKTVVSIEKKIPQKQVKEEKPSWVTNRNLRKITSESRTYSAKKIEQEKPKYRAPSPSKVISKPIDVITSSYGPGPLDADGRPLFGIKALRNGATNFQVKGTVVREEFHSRNGGAPEGVVSVTAYSSRADELERLLEAQGGVQGGAPPSRLHGLAAITTTKTFGGDTGTTYSQVHTKEERESLEQFTHSDRKIESFTSGVDSNTQFQEEMVVTQRSSDSERRGGKKERIERREDKKTVRQSSVKSLTEKYIKSANESGKVDRSKYPKAGLILRTAARRESHSSEDAPAGRLARTDSEHSLGSADEVVIHSGETSTRHQPARVTNTTVVVQEPGVTRVTHSRTERSFLDSSAKVTGVQDILTRMKNADIVVQEGESAEDSEARALLNKFLGASVLMAGMQGYVNEQPTGNVTIKEVHSRSSGSRVSGGGGGALVEPTDLDNCWDQQLLRKLLEQCTDYEQRRRLRTRIRTLMAEQEACAEAVSAQLSAEHAAESGAGDNGTESREEEVSVSASARRDAQHRTTTTTTTTTNTKVCEVSGPAPKPVSPFAKFRQLEKQNSTNSPNSPQSPGSPSQPYFKFTDPALHSSALTIKERLLQWCRDKTRDYENVKLENFSTSWADGLAFCALIHHFMPDAFDYSQLTARARRHNFTLAFKIADEKAGIYPLLDVDDMVAMRKPDWKCVFTYVQAIHRRFKDQD